MVTAECITPRNDPALRRKKEVSETRPKKNQIIIAVLAILLACTVGACVFMLVKFLSDNRTSTAENNYLLPFESTDAGLTEEDWISLLSAAGNLTLRASSPKENMPFRVIDMLPGDSVTQTFVVNVKDRDARELRFALRLIPGSKKLAEVLNIRIFTASANAPLDETTAPLYDGTFAELSEQTLSDPLILDLNGDSSEKIYYAICVSLDTSAGNEYQNLSLEAQFHWSILSENAETTTTTTSDGGFVSTETTTSISETAYEPETSRRPRPTTASETTGEPETSTSISETEIEPETSTSISETTSEPETSTSVSETEPPETSTSVSETTPEVTTTTTPPVTTEPADKCTCALNLPWCGEDTCLCPWCWLIPLLVILAAAAVTAWLVYRRLKKDNDKKPKGGKDDNVQSSR